MPPSRHSSSSHSSSSHSSSSHSSSSRSYSSSSRSSSRSSFSGPSRHSSSSHSSLSYQYQNHRYTSTTSPYVSGGLVTGRRIQRKRVNQPTGWKPSEHDGRWAETHYCVRHNYVYYPADWFDEATGKGYRKGYYDEEGTYYEDIVFKRNGKYENVICRCDYCGSVSKVDWSGDGQAPNCSNCGAVMRVESALDEYTQDPGYTNGTAVSGVSNRIRSRLIPVILLLIFAIFAVCSSAIKHGRQVVSNDTGWYNEDYDTYSLTNPELFGDTLYLSYNPDTGAYAIVDENSDWNKSLEWYDEFECYYDPVSDCYLWYNTDVDPSLWQYWYEGFSSKYGEYGWMEHDDEGWWVEVSEGDWQNASSSATSSFWYIDG